MSIVSEAIRWVKNWRTLPVYAWIRAGSLYRARRYEKAASLYEKGLQQFPQHKVAHSARLDLAHCYFRMQRFEECEQVLEQSLHANPNSRLSHIRLARLYLWLGWWSKAAEVLGSPALQLESDEEAARLFLYATSHLDSDAAPLFEERVSCILASNTSARIADVVRGMRGVHGCTSISPSHEAAAKLLVDRFEKMLAGTEVEPEVCLLIARFYCTHRKVFCARRALHRALTDGAQHPQIHSLLASTYLASGALYNSQYAIQLALDAVQRSGWHSPDALLVLAEAYLHEDDNLAALAILERAKGLVAEHGVQCSLERAEQMSSDIRADLPVLN